MVPWRKASVWCLFAPCLCCRSAYVSAFYLCRKEAHHLPAWMPSWILQLHQAVAKGVHLEVVAEDISNPTVYNNLTACRSIFRWKGKADLPLRCGDRYTSTTGVTLPRIRCIMGTVHVHGTLSQVIWRTEKQFGFVAVLYCFHYFKYWIFQFHINYTSN